MRRLVTSMALLSVVATVAAQDMIPVTSIKHAGRYDLATNTFYPVGSDPAQQSDGTLTLLYDNSATNGYLTTASGAITTHHFTDWGLPDFGGGGATVDQITIAYATNLVAPNNVALRVRLYEGTTGFGVQGTVIADYTLTGLPNSASGGYEGYTLDVTLPATLNLNDGAFGWSYNSDSTPITSTGPLLVGPPNAAGVENAYDRYLEADESYIGTFWFGGTPVASFVMKLWGDFVTPPPPDPWVKYGDAGGTFLNGVGPATPGSTDNEIRIKALPQTLVVLVVGLTQSDVVGTVNQINFYALPWLIELPPIVVPGAPTGQNLGTAVLPAPIPAAATVGLQIYMQAFGQNLAGVFKRESNGLELTIASP